MRPVARLLLAVSLILLPTQSLLAQRGIDPTGHWTGAIHVPAYDQNPAREVNIEVDLAKNANGALVGTFGQPAQNVKALPLANVAADGRSVSFELKATSGGGLFRGTITDAPAMSGEFITSEGGHSIPFSLTRTGDARIAPATKSAPIGKELEGTWNGTLNVNGRQERLVLTMANQPDGTATGTILDLDGGAVEIPIAMTQQAANVTIDVASVGGSYVAVLNAGTELVGTWTQGPLALPLTFKRAGK